MNKTEPEAPVFRKRQILKMAEFRKRRDLLSVLLEEDGTFTLQQVRDLLQKKNFHGE